MSWFFAPRSECKLLRSQFYISIHQEGRAEVDLEPEALPVSEGVEFSLERKASAAYVTIYHLDEGLSSGQLIGK